MQNPLKLTNKRIKHLNFLPSSSGIYKFLGSKKEVLYIGKAKDLRKRIKSYYAKTKSQSQKVRRLNSESVYLEITITSSELEALLLEQHLIKKEKPKYNVQFKDDKGYPWIKIATNSSYPSAISFLGKRDSKNEYFGPFPSSFAVKNTLKIIQKIFKIRDCKDSFFKNRKRPCLQYEIGRCSAPCVNEISRKDYLKDINQAKDLLNGKANNLLEVFYLEMDSYSTNKSYEKAADCRNKISSLREIQRDQSIAGYSKDRDAISISQSRKIIKIGVTSVRGGWIVSHKNFSEKNALLKEGLLDSFLASYYTSEVTCPNTILVAEELNDKNSLQIALSEFHKKKIHIRTRFRNKDVGLMKICQSNTDLYLKRRKRSTKNLEDLFISLKEKLNLNEDINLIESYDISHLSGRNALAGQVTYNNRGKVKDLYKIYNISLKNSGNDIGSMQEVIERRFSKINNLSILPSLILIDGAQTHLKAVREVLDKLKIEEVCLIAISKGARRKGEMDTVHNEQGKKLNYRKNSPELLFLQEIRDETHRFSIFKQRKKELKGIAKSSLDSIELVGAERKKALLRFFGSLEQIKKASPKDLMKVRGVGKRTADIIFRNLH